MLQNVYSLPDLIDLALTVPEVGAVNFNILHTVLHAIVQELKLTDVRPWCHIENPLIAKTAFTKAKLQEAAQRRIASESSLGEKVGLVFPGERGSQTFQEDNGTSRGKKDATAIPSRRESFSETPKKSKDEDRPAIEKKIPTKSYSATQTEEAEFKASEATPGKKDASVTPSKREGASASSKKSSSDEDLHAAEKQTPTRKDSTMQTEEAESKAEKQIPTRKDSTIQTEKAESKAEKQIPTRKDSTIQTEEAESKAEPDSTLGKKDTATSSKQESAPNSSKKSSDEDHPTTEKPILTRKDSTMQTEEEGESEAEKQILTLKDSTIQTEKAESKSEKQITTRKDSTIQTEEAASKEKKQNPARKDSTIQTEVESKAEKQIPARKDSTIQREENEYKTLDDIPEDLSIHKKPEQLPSERDEEEKEQEHERKKPGRNPQKAGEAWKYRHLSTRVEATEEGLHRLSNIVDIIVDKLRKTEKRKKEGGPASEELEAIDERILEVEEVLERYAADHDLLMELEKALRDMLKEFEEIKALAALLKQMQIDISKKADKEETWAALALKGDLELVNTKVDQLEFETAIEELGEAIGLLGLKFTRKNDEWEERAAEIWRGIDSKMSRDIFDEAIVKIESRLTALMYGLKILKQVVQDLLYPQASGVTRCILCRRPACISGLECIGVSGSPKRPHPDKSSGDEDSDKLKQTQSDAAVKRKKFDEPPYCKSKDTIISIPRSSSSYQSSAKEKKDFDVSQIKLMPKSTSDKEANQSRSATSRMKPKQKSKKEIELKFTMRRLAEYEKTEKASHTEKHKGTLETGASSHTSKSSRLSICTMPDPEEAATVFLPAMLMADPLRRDILRSPTSPKERKSGLKLPPLH